MLDDFDDFCQFLCGALFNRAANHGRLLRGAALHGCNQRQGGFPLSQIIAQILAHFDYIPRVIENIVNDLECGAQCLPIGGTCVLDGWW